MDVLATNQSLNATIKRNTADTANNAGAVTAFAIGVNNRPEVELSPQARILQQNEQVQSERREALQQRQQSPDETQQNSSSTSYVRVSSSEGTAQRNSLTSEEATELYRSIEKML